MIKKMLHQTLLSAFIIGIFAGGYAVTLGNGLEFSRSGSDRHSHDRWDG